MTKNDKETKTCVLCGELFWPYWIGDLEADSCIACNPFFCVEGDCKEKESEQCPSSSQ